MKCQNFEDLIQLSIDGHIRQEQQKALDAHLAACPDCAALLADMQAIHSILSTELSAVEPPADFVAATMAKLPPAPKPQKAPRLRFKFIFGLGSFAACAAAVLFMIFGGQTQPEQPLIAEDNQPNQVLISQAEEPSNTQTVPEDRLGDQPIENIEPSTIAPLPTEPNEAPATDPIAIDSQPDTQNEESGEQVDNNQPAPAEEPAPAQVQVAANEPAAISANPELNAEPEIVHGVLEIPQPAHQQIIIPVDVFMPKLFAAFDCDAIMPHIDENGLVNYYTNYRGYYQKWQQELISEAESIYIENSDNLPDMASLFGYNNYDDAVNTPLSYALSPDNSLLAVNNGSDVNNGIWLFANNAPTEATTDAAQPSEQSVAATDQAADGQPADASTDANANSVDDIADEQQDLPANSLYIDMAELDFSTGTSIFIDRASGELLNWSPNGSKLLFTDSDGLLYVYYAYYGGEQRYYQLSEVPVTSADWSADSRLVLFSAQQEGDNHSNIYMVMVP